MNYFNVTQTTILVNKLLFLISNDLIPFQTAKKEASINSQNLCITQTQIQSDETNISTNISSSSVVHSNNADVKVFT